MFVINAYLEPNAVIRQALGQILEYAFYPTRKYDLPVRLFIVGRRPPTPQDKAYLQRFEREFGLSVGYRVVAIGG